MVAAVKEICIFMIIAQAVLFFVPGASYAKYVRVLVGIIIILRITEPIFGLFLDEGKKQEILERVRILEQEIETEEKIPGIENPEEEIYQGIEDELRSRLAECGSGYEVTDVAIDRKGSGIVITLEREENLQQQEMIRVEQVKLEEALPGEDQEESTAAKKEEVSAQDRHKLAELKELYGSCIGVEAEKLTIVFQTGGQG